MSDIYGCNVCTKNFRVNNTNESDIEINLKTPDILMNIKVKAIWIQRRQFRINPHHNQFVRSGAMMA